MAPPGPTVQTDTPPKKPPTIRDGLFESFTAAGNNLGFSGCDISATIMLPQYQGKNSARIFRIGTLQTISISTYNTKTPVKALGFKNPIAVARGGRTIAGTLIFNQLHTHVFNDNYEFPLKGDVDVTWDRGGLLGYASGDAEYITKRKSNAGAPEPEKNRKIWDFSWDTNYLGEVVKPSDLPPFDIIITMINEAGHMGKIILEDIEIIHDSSTLSVEDIYTEVQYQYMASNIRYFEGTIGTANSTFSFANAFDSGLEPVLVDSVKAATEPTTATPAIVSPAPANSSSNTPEQRREIQEEVYKYNAIMEADSAIAHNEVNPEGIPMNGKRNTRRTATYQQGTINRFRDGYLK